jgi:hypothetical protein
MRLTSEVQVKALFRQVSSLGGFATVIAKGDKDRGEILVLALEKGQFSSIWQRILQYDGAYQWAEISPQSIDNKEKIENLIRSRRKSDPDLWIIELDIPQEAQLNALLSELG